MTLPTAWLETTAPAKLPIWSVVSGRTFQRSLQIQSGAPLVPVDLTDCTAQAVISDRTGTLIIAMTATITDDINGWVQVRLTPTQTEAMGFPADHPPGSNRAIIGRADVVITDASNDKVSVGQCDVELIRGEA